MTKRRKRGTIVNVQDRRATYTTAELAEMFDLTPRTLRWYNQIGILQPSSQDNKKRYTQREVDNLKTIQQLREAGYKPSSIKDILRATKVMPATPVSTESAMREALEAARGEEQSIEYGTDERAYNTNYKRLRRIANDLGLSIFMSRKDGVLRFRTRRKNSN